MRIRVLQTRFSVQIIILISFCLTCSNKLNAQFVYVSPSGYDTNTGAIDKPLKNIQTAIDQNTGKSVTIILRGGTYEVKNTILIKPDNSGLKLMAYGREQVILTSGRKIDNWVKVKHPLPGKSRPKTVYRAFLQELENVLTVYDKNGNFLPRCASPRFKTLEQKVQASEGANIAVSSNSDKKATTTLLFYNKGQLDNVKDYTGAEIFILPRFDWVANYLPIKEVDKKRRMIETVCPGTYELTTPPTWTKIELYFQIENLPGFLDEPGEWYFDKTTKALYLVTENNEKPEGIIVPQLNHLICIQGDLTSNNLVDNVTIQGINFECAERMTWEHGRIGVQHDWGVVDGDWACIKMTGTTNSEISDCLFRNSGGDGVRIDLVGWNNRINNNEFTGLGGAAISLIGYAPGTQDRLHSNLISSNYIRDCAKLWWLQPGIMVCQSSSNLIRNNLVHDMPYNGMAFVGSRSAFSNGKKSKLIEDGLSYVNWDEIPADIDQWYERMGYISTRDNIIEHNEVYDVVKKLGDGNAIYLSGTGVGNILQKNYIHSITSLSSAGGLRFDNATWFCTIKNNVVWNVTGSSVVSKKVNNVENNIFVNSGVRASLNLPDGPKWGSNIRRNIIVNKRSVFEPTMNQWMKPEFILATGKLNECIITDNILFVPDDLNLGENVSLDLNKEINHKNNLHLDPFFYDMENGDFRLKSQSPALKLGFVPFNDYGLISPVGRIIK